MEAIILAGGKGTRLYPLIRDIPKPMVKIAGKSLLIRQIEFCKNHKIRKIHILVYHLSDKIVNEIGDGSYYDLNIIFHKEEKPLGTAGSVKQIEKFLDKEFLVLYGDVFFDIYLKKALNFFNEKQGLGVLLCHPNNHPFDSDLMEINSDGKILNFFPKPRHTNRFYPNMSNAGIYILRKEVLKYVEKNRFLDFGKDVFPSIIQKKLNLYGYNTSEYISDIGTPKRLLKVNQDFQNLLPHNRNLKLKQKAVFIDRDGTLIKYVPYIKKIGDVELYKKSHEALKLWQNNNYIIIVVTNQPQVARGEISIKNVHEMHNKIDTMLGKEGVKIDAYYFCPHHPDSGFEGEIKKLKIKCNCRKPELGLYMKAACDFNIDFSKSIFVGDSTRDIVPSKILGGKSILLSTGISGKDKKYEIEPDHYCNDLLSAAQMKV